MHSVSELVCEPNDIVTSVNKIPSLSKIAAQFISGRPIDASLNRNLEYNEFENNPLLKKGVDLADLDEISEKVKTTLQKATEELERQKVASKVQKEGSQIENPESKPPEKVS